MPVTTGRPSRPPEVRFWERVEKTAGCWIWLGPLDKHGYGKIRVGPQTVLAHRFVFSLIGDPVPAAREVDHLCRNRRCVRPEHLRQVDEGFNRRQGHLWNLAKTHCCHGHEFTPANTYVVGRRRQCRICRTERSRQSRMRKRAA